MFWQPLNRYELLIELKKPCRAAKSFGLKDPSAVRSPMNVSNLAGMELFNYWNIKQVVLFRTTTEDAIMN